MSFLNKDQTQLFMQIANCIIPPTDNLPGAGNLDIFDNKECDLEITSKQENHIIEFLDENERKKESEENRQFIIDNHDRKKVIEKLLNIYRKQRG